MLHDDDEPGGRGELARRIARTAMLGRTADEAVLRVENCIDEYQREVMGVGDSGDSSDDGGGGSGNGRRGGRVPRGGTNAAGGGRKPKSTKHLT